MVEYDIIPEERGAVGYDFVRDFSNPDYDIVLNIPALYDMYDNGESMEEAKKIHAKLSVILPELQKLRSGPNANKEQYNEISSLIESRLIPGMTIDVSDMQLYYSQTGKMPFLHDEELDYEANITNRLESIKEYTNWEAGAIEKSVGEMNRNLTGLESSFESDPNKEVITKSGMYTAPVGMQATPSVTTEYLDKESALKSGEGLHYHTIGKLQREGESFKKDKDSKNRISSSQNIMERFMPSTSELYDYYSGAQDYVGGEVALGFGDKVSSNRVIPSKDALDKLNQEVGDYLKSKHASDFEVSQEIRKNLSGYNASYQDIASRIESLNRLSEYTNKLREFGEN